MVRIHGHAKAIAAARAFATEASVEPSLLVVLGLVGVGKTELVQKLASDVSAAGHRQCTFVTARDLITELVEAVRRNVLHQMTRRFGHSDLVVIEDVDDLRDRPAAQAELGRLIASWVAGRARIACTVGCSLQRIAEFDERLPPSPMTRVVILRRPSRREMREALKSLATAMSISIDRQSLRELALWCDGDIRRAVGAIRQLRFETERRAGRI